MGRLSKRIRRLERAPERVACPSCGGRGPTGLRVHLEGWPDPEPSPCRGCGRDAPLVIRVTRRADGPAGRAPGVG